MAKSLADRLEADLIEENYQPLYGARLQKDFPPRIMEVLNNKQQLENTSQRFVTDRCPIDLIHTWLNQSCHTINRPLTHRFMERCLQQVKNYDFVILTAWNSIELVQSQEPLPRNMDILEQLRHHSALAGHVHMWVQKSRIIEIPQSMKSLDDRVELVISEIKKRRPGLLQTAPVSTP